MLRIAETNTSIYSYHLVRATTSELQQGRLEAICGKDFFGWETEVQVLSWGVKSHFPYVWCKDCSRLRETEVNLCPPKEKKI